MNYQEYTPHRELALFVECYWSGGTEASSESSHSKRVLPDTCIDLLWTRGQSSSLSLVGPMTVAEEFDTEPGTSFSGIRFRAGGAAALLGIHARDYRDAVVEIETVLGGAGQRLSQASSAGLVDRLEAFLLDRRRSADSDSVGFIRFLSALYSDFEGGYARSGYSDRHLRRLFDRWVGLSVVSYRRIARLQRLIRTDLRYGLAAAAADCGYYDQPHMNRDVGRLTGISPTQLAAEHMAVFSKQARPTDR